MIAMPQSDLLAQVSSLRLPSGISGPVFTLSNAAHASLPSPRLLVAGAGVCAASPLGELPLGTQSVGFNYLFFLPVMLPSVLARLPADLAVRVFPGVWKLLFFMTPFLPLLSLFLSFIFFPTSFRRQWAAFLGA